ncbi:MAG: hypothetical protein ACOCY7_03940 [Halodesulfurarchaeum sp.]
MVEAHLSDLDGERLRYHDRTWELTGDVEVLKNGELLAVEAKQIDDVKGSTVTLDFGLEGGAGSLNPGNLGEHFNSLDRRGSTHAIVVEKGRQTYTYTLHRLSYE